jgi:putative Ig domain-containing protein
MKKGTFLFSLLLLANFGSASTWSRTYSEPNKFTGAYTVGPTSDGGFFAAGVSYTSSNDPSSSDIILMKVDASGDVQWRKTYGGNDKDITYATIQTSDGGFLIAGSTNSFGAGIDDFWLLKLDSSGDFQWQKTYGSSQSETAYSVAQTPDGGYVVCGTSAFLGGSAHFFVLKVDSSGDYEWQRILGNFSSGEFSPTLTLTSDGGYILAGSSPAAGWQTVLIKLNSNGNPQWQKFYQPGGVAVAGQRIVIQEATGGGYVILTQTWINSNFGLGFFKVNSSGDLQWLKVFELNQFTNIRDFDQTSDGGFILVGSCNDAGAGTIGAWVLKLNSSGNVQWEKTYDTPGYDEIHSIQQLSDDGFIAGGMNKASGASFGNLWMLKMESDGSIDSSCNFVNDISIAPSTPTTTVGDSTNDIVGTFIDPQSTSITPATQSVTMTEQCSGGCPAITVSPSSLPDGVLGIAYNQTIIATGGTAPYTYAVTSGTLPAGLSLDQNSGIISGTPTTVQTATFQITATDSAGCTGSHTYTIDINGSCLFCDDFEDGVQPNWLITKQNFTETGGSYVGTPTGNKAETIASPVFSGCTFCSIEVVMRTAGGAFNKVWLLTFYTTKVTLIELLMKEETDRWVLKQRINKTVVAKGKGIAPIDPNVDYDVIVSYDGTAVNVSINGSQIITMTAVGAPVGTVGFRVKRTVGSFNSILVN